VDCLAIKWDIFTPYIRSLLSDYAVTVAIIAVTLFSFIPMLSGHQDSGVDSSDTLSIARVSVPSGLAPTTRDRPWLISFSSEAYESFYARDGDSSGLIRDDMLVMVAMAFAISIPIVFFFYIDQNLSCVLAQAPHIDGMKEGKLAMQMLMHDYDYMRQCSVMFNINV
jgi:hypothetical protein